MPLSANFANAVGTPGKTDPFSRLDLSVSRFRPHRGWLLVRRDDPPERMGLLYLPAREEAAARRDVSFGTVVAAGPSELCSRSGRPLPAAASVGDRVVLDRFTGHDFKFAEGAFVLVRADALVCALEDAPDEEFAWA